ncbi:NBS-LRR type resistance protein [Cucumis melo var. makuwa]|uniref:NBS-LRR type resistance protein n=1 Tax=Cucumis melo var. makuwa TaxID=1194695 RepID=A0A5D3DRH5_CUCMM|nr:NBS-LRR type resistance protein [Cucumis melo var. makuwa]
MNGCGGMLMEIPGLRTNEYGGMLVKISVFSLSKLSSVKAMQRLILKHCSLVKEGLQSCSIVLHGMLAMASHHMPKDLDVNQGAKESSLGETSTKRHMLREIKDDKKEKGLELSLMPPTIATESSIRRWMKEGKYVAPWSLMQKWKSFTKRRKEELFRLLGVWRAISHESSGSVERTYQSSALEGCTYQSSAPEGCTYQSSAPEGCTDQFCALEGCTYQSSAPEGCTHQSSAPEGCTYQSSAPEGCTYQSSAPEGCTYP